jgi:hypothetical protein
MMAARTTTIWLVTLLATAALAQSPSIGSEPPKLHGQTLDEKNIVLPDETGGKVTLLVVSLSRKAGERKRVVAGTFRRRLCIRSARDLLRCCNAAECSVIHSRHYSFRYPQRHAGGRAVPRADLRYG